MAANRPVSLRIPEPVRAAIQAEARRTRRTFSSVAIEMLDEAVKMRRVPGIIFANEPYRRAPWIAGTGLEVWDVVRSWIDMGKDWDSLREVFNWLSESQLRSALAYAEAYPEYVEECERLEAEWTPEQFRKEPVRMRVPSH